MKSAQNIILTAAIAGFFAGCVPKTHFEDQQAKLKEAQAKLDSLANDSSECDKDTFMQLREQAQSLELLNQELLGRNTELAKENSRLKVVDSQSRAEESVCDRRLQERDREWEGKLSRTKETFDDLVKELKAEINRLKADLEAARAASSRPKSSKSSKSEKK